MKDHLSARANLVEARRIVVKLGTRTLVRRDGRPDHRRMARLVDEMAALHRSGREVVVVSSGAIGSGLEALGWKRRPRQLHELQVAAAVGQSRLMSLYDHLFRKQNLKVGQVLLTHDGLKERERHLNARRTLLALLDYGIVPVVNENDAVMVEEIKFGDNDLLAALVSVLIDADLLVLLTTVDGLRAPTATGRTRRVPWLDTVSDEALALAFGKGSELSTGGMASKLQSARMSAEAGIPVVMAHGGRAGALQRIVEGHSEGTLIGAREDGLSRRKRWISCFHRTSGTLIVDAGARHALVEGGRSLLPIGIMRVEGRFSTGALVNIRTESGETIAKGLVEYPSDRLQEIRGLRTAELRARGPAYDIDEAVHRDNLVLTAKGDKS